MSRATVKDLYNVMAVDDGARVPRYKLNYLPPPKKKNVCFQENQVLAEPI